jgi:hypothetical protein
MSRDKDRLGELRATPTLLELAAARLDKSATRLEQAVINFLEKRNSEHK